VTSALGAELSISARLVFFQHNLAQQEKARIVKIRLESHHITCLCAGLSWCKHSIYFHLLASFPTNLLIFAFHTRPQDIAPPPP